MDLRGLDTREPQTAADWVTLWLHARRSGNTALAARARHELERLGVDPNAPGRHVRDHRVVDNRLPGGLDTR